MEMQLGKSSIIFSLYDSPGYRGTSREKSRVWYLNNHRIESRVSEDPITAAAGALQGRRVFVIGGLGS